MAVNYPMGNQDISSWWDNLSNSKHIKQDLSKAQDICGHIGEAALHAVYMALNIVLNGTMAPCDGCAKANMKAESVSKI